MPVSAPPKPPRTTRRKALTVLLIIAVCWGLLILVGQTFDAIFNHNKPNIVGEWVVILAFGGVIFYAITSGVRR